MRFAAFIPVLALLSGCAGAPRVLDYYPEGADAQSPMSWPGSSDIPRLEYAGQLLGEQNFVTNEAEGGGARFLRWLTGLGRGRDRIIQLVRPQTGIVDSRGRILVTDGGSPSVFVFDEVNGSYAVWREAMPGIDFLSPVGIAELLAGGYLVVDADIGAIFVLSPDGVPLGRFTTETLLRPTGLDIDPDNGEVYVADKGASHIKVFSPGGVLLRTIGVAGDSAGELNAPMHICISDGKLLVSDALNAKVQIFAMDDGRWLGQIGRRGLYVGNLVRPKGVTTDRDGNIYVIESYYDHLLIYNQSGELLLPVGGTGNGIGRFFLPAGAWSDERDRIFIADMFNARVVIFRYVSTGA
ncbi:MAG: SBBP repeat-containing protein [Gammaproteobacteria bacterium]|nr:SBBP repeat-containing protein [Gammaproteobacteria bacterium]MDH5617533.1 SBBP repeat-containing protein [Gammaproteobacteria bacterium]